MTNRQSIVTGCATIVAAYLYLHGGGVRGALVLISNAVGQLSWTLLAIGGALGARAVWFWRRATAIAAWPVTAGVITESRVESRRRQMALTMRNNVKARFYRPLVVYAYSVEGVPFEGRQLQLGSRGWTLEPADAERRAARYAAGTNVHVSYDPARPGDSFLDPRPGPLTRQAVAWSAACLALGAYGLTV